jgi:hypothetical protein
VAQGAAADKKRGVGHLGVRFSRTTEFPLLTGSLRLVPIRARHASRRIQAGDEASVQLGLGAAQREGTRGAVERGHGQ